MMKSRVPSERQRFKLDQERQAHGGQSILALDAPPTVGVVGAMDVVGALYDQVRHLQSGLAAGPLGERQFGVSGLWRGHQ